MVRDFASISTSDSSVYSTPPLAWLTLTPLLIWAGGQAPRQSHRHGRDRGRQGHAPGVPPGYRQ
jgi:hypothetical protein